MFTGLKAVKGNVGKQEGAVEDAGTLAGNTQIARRVVEFCHEITKKNWNGLQGGIPVKEPGVSRFVPGNFDTSKISTPKEFNFSIRAED